MVRAKGGKRQPRYYQLKDAGSERLLLLLKYTTEIIAPRKMTMEEISEQVGVAIAQLKQRFV